MSINYTMVAVIMLFVILISIQFTLNKIFMILKEIKENITIEQLLHSYIRADGKAYFEAVNTEEYGSDGVYQSLVRRKYVASKLTDLLTGLQRKNGIAVSDSAKKKFTFKLRKYLNHSGNPRISFPLIFKV